MSVDTKKAAALTYESSGVSISAQDEAIGLFAAAVAETQTAASASGAGEVIAGVGAFGAAFLPNLSGMAEPVLISSTDGLGTKTLLHARFESWEAAGLDLVGTVVNDVLCSGARPLFMLDYIGWNGLTPAQLAAIVRGVAAGCAAAGCALVGGELAEMRSIYKAGDFDLTGTALGLADRAALLGPQRVQAGSVLIGLPSSGPHANGFSLARSALAQLPAEAWQEQILTVRGDEPLWQALTAPTVCYARALRTLRETGVELQAAAHVSGGGLQDNLPRVIPEGLQALVQRSAVPQQAVFDTIQRCGQVSRDEMWHVFNMGCGFVLIAAAEQSEAVMRILQSEGHGAFVLGEVTVAVEAARFAWAD